MDISNLRTYIYNSYWGKINSRGRLRPIYLIIRVFSHIHTSLSSPFNENKFLGWISSFSIRVSFGYAYMLINVSTLAFMLAMGLYIKASTHHFRIILAEIGHKNTSLETKSSIVEAVEFHKTTKRCIRNACLKYFRKFPGQAQKKFFLHIFIAVSLSCCKSYGVQQYFSNYLRTLFSWRSRSSIWKWYENIILSRKHMTKIMIFLLFYRHSPL